MKTGVTDSPAIWETIKYAKAHHGWTEPGTDIYDARAAVQAHKSTAELPKRRSRSAVPQA